MNLENEKDEKYQLLSSGKEFFNDLFSEIDLAKKYIIIKSFLWRNDKVGRLIAEKLKQAADRGVKILILKDRIGAFYEYGQENGQSFFHDAPLQDSLIDVHSLNTVYRQSQVLSSFYKNGVKPPEKNFKKKNLTENNNCRVVDQYKLYDHSKVIVVDDEIAYIGGITFGDEFYRDDGERWIDYMLKFNDKDACRELLKVLIGEKASQLDGMKFLTDSSLKKQGSSMHQYAVDFIKNSKEKLLIEMPFLGHPDYINALTEIIKKRVQVILILPAQSTSHHYRNLHFLKRLKRQINGSNFLKTIKYPSMVHSKIMVRDEEEALLGSHNLHLPLGVMEETNVDIGDKGLVGQIIKRLDQDLLRGKEFDTLPDWRKILPRSRAEYLMIEAQKWVSEFRAKEIERVRELCRKTLENLLSPDAPVHNRI